MAMSTTLRAETYRVERLPWDSAHFGIPVARLRGAPSDEAALRQAVESAREAGIQLLYFAAEPEEKLPNTLLRELGGYEVDWKATFEAQLDGHTEEASHQHFVLSEYPAGLPCPRLVALAIAAGNWSRYRRDPRIPAEAFEALYQRWITRSTLREIADTVLVASAGAAPDQPLGLLTLSTVDAAGSIGLIAVEQGARGCGVGSLLLRGGHHWLAQRGAQSVSVVTQLDNRPACRLYEKGGYRLCDVKLIYHFWPPELSEPLSAAVDRLSPVPRSDHHGPA